MVFHFDTYLNFPIARGAKNLFSHHCTIWYRLLDFYLTCYWHWTRLFWYSQRYLALVIWCINTVERKLGRDIGRKNMTIKNVMTWGELDFNEGRSQSGTQGFSFGWCAAKKRSPGVKRRFQMHITSQSAGSPPCRCSVLHHIHQYQVCLWAAGLQTCIEWF